MLPARVGKFHYMVAFYYGCTHVIRDTHTILIDNWGTLFEDRNTLYSVFAVTAGLNVDILFMLFSVYNTV